METNEISALVRVLIVDDHKLLRDGLTKMLHTFKKELPVTVMEAESGEIALRMLSNFPFDLCIIDYQLPSLTGPETLIRMLRFKPGLKVLALSNYNEIKCISEMLEAGALGYVLKSVHATQLLSAINTVLAGKRYFCNEVEHFRKHLGPNFLQMSETFAVKRKEELIRFLFSLPVTHKFFLELQHESWFNSAKDLNEIAAVLKSNKIGFIITDTILSETFCRWS
jgi:DNA-binding NarL/FixJ family response regulator